MINLIIVVILLTVTFAGYRAIRRERGTLNDALTRWSKLHALDIVRYDVLPGASQAAGPGQLRITFRRHGLREFEECVVGWKTNLLGLTIDAPPPPPQRPGAFEGTSYESGVLRPLSAPATADERVRAEVVRRLNLITSQSGWAKNYDLDGSGHIDEDEWQILCQNTEREVREELGDTSEPAPAEGGVASSSANDAWQGDAW